MLSIALLTLLYSSIVDQRSKSFADNVYAGSKDDRRVFFTPLIESGMLEKARKNAEVHLEGETDIKSFAGYFTVNEKYNSNLFTWYFPAQTDSENAPVILWLQGGPGQSMFYGIFSEHGPFTIDSQMKLEKRDTSWNNNHNMIYIDSPTGTGFSFSESMGYATNASSAARDLLTMLTQFFQLFPELQQNDFFISGESYGGKYASYLACAVREFNKEAPVKINLKGISIGNGFTDPIHQLNFSTYLYWTGLLDFRERDELREIEDKTVELIEQENFYEAFWAYSKVQNFITHKSGFKNRYNYLHIKDTTVVDDWATWAQREDVVQALHATNVTEFRDINWSVYWVFMHDFLQSAAHLLPELVREYRVLLYNGHLDILVAHQFTESFILNTKWDGVEEYKTTRRKLWWYEDELAGYSKSFGNLTHVLVRNAGHMVPADQPKWAFDMITKFTRNETIGVDIQD